MNGIPAAVAPLLSLTFLSLSCSLGGARESPRPPAATRAALARILALAAQRRPDDATLEGLCRNPEPRVRVRALRALGRSGDPEVRFTLAAHLEDPHPEVRREALTALALLGPEAAGPGLPLLHAPEAELRLLAALLAGRSGRPEMVPALTGLLTDPSPWVRGEAALGLGFLAKKGKLERNRATAALDALLARVEEEQETEVLWRVAWSLTHLVVAGEKECEPRLRRLAAPPRDWRTRLFALRALARLSALAPESRALLRRTMTGKVPALAVEAMLVLAWPGYPRLDRPPARIETRPRPLLEKELAALLELARSGPSLVRQTACACLGFQSGQGAALRRLMAAAGEEDPRVAASALTALARWGGTDFLPLVGKVAAAAPWQLRRAAALAGGLVAGPAGLELCLSGAKDRDPRVRLAAAKGLRYHVTHAKGRMAVRDLLGDDHPSLVEAAARALGGTAGPGLAPALAGAWNRARRAGDFPIRCALLEAMDAAAALAESPEARRMRREGARDLVPRVKEAAGAEEARERRSPHPAALLPTPPPDRIPPPGTVIRMETEKGELAVVLDVDLAPRHAHYWVDLARAGRLKGRQVHHWDPTFGLKAFGADPLEPGPVDRQGRLLSQELSLRPVAAGTVLATSLGGPDTDRDGLFLCLVPCPFLRGKATVVGHLLPGGLACARRLREGDRIVAARVEEGR